MNLIRRAINALTFEVKFEGYVAEHHPDNTYTIRNVPIFGEVAADSNGNKVAVSTDWLRAALDRGLQLQSEGFAGPVHNGHHGKWDALGQAKDERERIGALALRDLRPMKVEGKVEQTLFADITGVSAEKFERIRKEELPHVSVEYIEEHRPAIDSLAMTGSSCPFKRYPNMKISKVVEAPKPVCYTVAEIAPPGKAAKFFDVEKGEDKTPAKDAKKDDAPPATGNAGNQEAQNNQPGTDNANPDAAAEASVGVAPPWAVSMTQAFGGLLSAVQSLCSKMGVPFSPAQPSGPVTLPQASTTPIVATVEKPATPAAMDALTFGTLMGRVAVLEGDLAKREKEVSTALTVATFEAKCKGWPFDDSDRKGLRTCIETGGDIAAQAFVDQVKKRPKDMVARASDFRATSEPVQDSPAVMTYVTKGPATLEHARRFSVMHSQLVAAGMNPSPEDKFIEHQFATAADLHRANVILKGEK